MSHNAPAVLEMLAQLIAAPSVSSVSPAFDMGNRKVVELLANWLDDLGFNTDIIPIPDMPNKANLIAQLGNGEDGLVLAGHTDTVPYDQTAWRHDPFTLVEEDGKLYGLGTTDMKGFIAIAVEAAKAFRTQTLSKPLIILATADEESTMKGALHLTKLGRPRARYAVIGEPTSLVPVRMHKGVAMEALKLTGRAGHSSNPTLGVNALDGMNKAINTIIAWRAELADRVRNEAFDIPYTTLNLGYIRGGDNPNRICGQCELHFDMRLMPGMNMAQLRPELQTRLNETLADSGLQLEMRNLDVEVPSFETPADTTLVRLIEEITGQRARSIAFASEAPFLQQLGIETIICGPGDIEVAHQPDEFLLVDRIQTTQQLLEQLIRRTCCTD
jgi:acetylornithine deacetylase